MNIPRYWARATQTAQNERGESASFSCWHWSDTGVSDAQQKAQARAAELARKLLNAEKLERYGYGVRPLREEIREGIGNQQHNELALVTRNAYGALILNAANAMFIDIDFPSQAFGGLLGAIKRLFGKPAVSPQAQYVQIIEQWAANNPHLGMRVYRTYGGLRCLITSQVFDPTSPDALAVMQALPSDPLYLRLCQSQACFRARLTPKPWRVGLCKPPLRYPWQDAKDERQYRQWEQIYTQAAAKFSVCHLVKQFGSSQIHPDVEPILTFHDRVAGIEAERPLA